MRTATSKQGFTIVELIVVIGMLMLLAGAITTSVQGAHRRAKIQQATIEAQEMTKAILAYENYGQNYSLEAHAKPDGMESTEQNLGFILGKETRQGKGQSGQIPILFNAAVTRSGKILDPWGNPYIVTIKKDTVDQEDRNKMTFKSCVTFPNFNRRPADELKLN